jgi:hypothetical protein
MTSPTVKRQFVVVIWDDAWQDQENFTTAHGIISTHEPMPVETMGWLIQEDAIGVSVANERSTQDGHDVFRGRTFIPRAMIKSVTPFNLTKPRKKRSPSTSVPPAS